MLRPGCCLAFDFEVFVFKQTFIFESSPSGKRQLLNIKPRENKTGSLVSFYTTTLFVFLQIFLIKMSSMKSDALFN